MICNIDNEVNRERFDKDDNAINNNRELCMNKDRATIFKQNENQASGFYGNYEDTQAKIY